MLHGFRPVGKFRRIIPEIPDKGRRFERLSRGSRRQIGEIIRQRITGQVRVLHSRKIRRRLIRPRNHIPVRRIRNIATVGIDRHQHDLVHARIAIGVLHFITRRRRIRSAIPEIPDIRFGIADRILQVASNGTQPDVSHNRPFVLTRNPAATPAKLKAIFTAASLQPFAPAPLSGAHTPTVVGKALLAPPLQFAQMP